MATKYGQVYSSDLIGVPESVVDQILLLNPHQTPMINLVGFGQEIANVEHSWYEDEMFADQSTVSAAKTATDTSIPVADADPFRVGHVVKVGDELMLVTAVDSVNKVLTVSRGYAGTTAAAISSGATIEVLFTEGDEGQLARQARFKPRKREYNLTQIFDDSIEIAGTTLAINQYNIDNIYEYERQKKILELALQLEKAVINGIRYENGTKRMMGGVRSFIQTNVINGSGLGSNGVTYDTLLTQAFRQIYEAGGMATGAHYVIMVGAKQKTALSTFDVEKVRLTRAENTRGQIVDHWVSDFGQAEILLNNNLQPDEILVIDANRISIRPLKGREFSHEFLGKVGDKVQGMIVGKTLAA